MTARYSQIAADIKAKLETVQDIGVVHAYERQATDLRKFIELFKSSDGRIRGWEITRRAVPEDQRGATSRHHQMVLRGYQGLQDAEASAVAFQDLCDDICDLFRTAEFPAGSKLQYLNALDTALTPVQIEQIEDRMFGNVLCHTAIIAVSVTERINP